MHTYGSPSTAQADRTTNPIFSACGQLGLSVLAICTRFAQSREVPISYAALYTKIPKIR